MDLPQALADLAKEAGLDPTRLKPGARLTDLGLDSMKVAQLVVAVEQAFDVTIPGDDLAGLETVGDVVAYLRRL
jgi:acyl carrier protein